MIHYLLWGTEQSVDRRCGGPSAGAGPWETEAEGGSGWEGKHPCGELSALASQG